jgi:hypothetical protein
MDSLPMSTFEASLFASRFGTVKMGSAQCRGVRVPTVACLCSSSSEVLVRFCLSLLPVRVQERPYSSWVRRRTNGQRSLRSECNQQAARHFRIAGMGDPADTAGVHSALAWHLQSETPIWTLSEPAKQSWLRETL